MQMKNNQNGSALLSVMLLFLVFAILGLTLLSVSIGGAKRTEFRETEVTDNLDSIKAVKEGTALIQSYVKLNQKELLKEDAAAFKKKFQEKIINAINNKELDFKLADLSETEEYKKRIGADSFTRVIEVRSEEHKQKVYITAMPSFLKYALGSRSQLTINGSPYIQGNLYSKKPMQISRDTNYKYKKNYFSTPTELPAVKENSRLFVEEGALNICTSPGCYTAGNSWIKNESNWRSILPGQLQEAFSTKAPLYEEEKSEFVDVDIPKTFQDKLMETGFDLKDFNGDLPHAEKIQYIKEKLSGYLPSGVRQITNFSNLSGDNSTKGFIYKGTAEIDTDDLNLDKDQWLIIDGDATIESRASSQMDVNANILITGNLIISGQLSFNSVIYVLGDTTLKNVNITCYKNSCSDDPAGAAPDAQLILMTQGKLEISRINSFMDLGNNTNKITGYLYTNSQADIYAVGSLLNINGGIFSFDDLVVNSFRGNARGGEADLLFTPLMKPDESRFTVTNNKRLFLDQLQALPRVDGLEVIPELMEKIKGK
ncbi:hypothetical protein V1498_05685 [Peribacillus sp. SCS-26]|uniref:hypothetical protein n=1 Tax=Paraperibacillus marinus TaxID=3115295 RepID=UPI00390590D5